MKTRIDFILAGVQKGGTSAISHYLGSHPDISMTKTKEGHYFDRANCNRATDPEYASYHALFEFDSGEIRGETTPVYMYWKGCMEKIYDYNPDIKIIISLRNPVDRAFSQYNMEFSRGTERQPFSAVYSDELRRVASLGCDQHRVVSYIDRGFYSRQLEKIYQLFPKENVLPIKYELFLKDNDHVMQSIYRFLGVKKFPVVREDVFKIPRKTGHLQQYRKMLCDTFKEDIAQLEAMLGWDCSDWKS